MKYVRRPLICNGTDELKIFVRIAREVERGYNFLTSFQWLPPSELSGSGLFIKKPITFIAFGFGIVKTLDFSLTKDFVTLCLRSIRKSTGPVPQGSRHQIEESRGKESTAFLMIYNFDNVLTN